MGSTDENMNECFSTIYLGKLKAFHIVSHKASNKVHIVWTDSESGSKNYAESSRNAFWDGTISHQDISVNGIYHCIKYHLKWRISFGFDHHIILVFLLEKEGL